MDSNYFFDKYDENSLTSKFYEEWDDSPEEPCPDCKGTGLDRWEEYECETCFGEGVLPPVLSAIIDPVLPAALSGLPELTGD